MTPKVEGEATLGVEDEVTSGVEDEVTLGVEDEVTLGVEAESASSSSLSYTKPRVVGMKDVPSDAILWICSIINLGSFSVNFSRRS